MTKKKSTKRALISSLLILAMCFTILAGTTFAWFTDSVASSGNIIKAGKLDVSMKYADGTKAVPTAESSDWKDASTGAIFKYDLWEPGYVDVKHIAISNDGTLALKYKVQIVANGEVSELADVIDVYYYDPAAQIAARTAIDENKKIGTLRAALSGMDTTASGNLLAGEKDVITIALKMQESAGNDYQMKSIGTDFSIVLLATQYTYEEDSFNDQYDAAAKYDEPVTVTDLTEFAQAIADGAKDIQLAPGNYGTLTIDNTADIEDVKIDATDAQLLMDIQAGAKMTGVTISNYAPTGAINGNYNGSVTIRDGADVDITFKDSVFKPEVSNGAAVRSYASDAKLHFDNCTFDGTGSRYAFYRAGEAIDELEFVNCTFQNFKKRVIMWNGGTDKAAKIVIDGCTFKDSNPVDGLLKTGSAQKFGVFTFTNNTLTNFVPTEGFFTTDKSDVTAPIYLTDPNCTVTVSGNTKDGAAWDPQGLILA